MKSGIAASKGYAIGEVILKSYKEIKVTDELVTDIEAEKEKFALAVEEAKKQLEKVREQAALSMGEEEAMIFDTHIMMLEDVELIEAICSEIEVKHSNAIKAISQVTNSYIAKFEEIDDVYLKERAADLKDITFRLIANLTGNCVDIKIDKENTIVVAHDLTPSDTAQLDKDKVIAFLTNVGSRTSHSAIMARTLEIPAVVGLGDITTTLKNGDKVIVDGFTGNVIINPSHDEVEKYKEKIREYQEETAILKKFVSSETISKQGKRIYVAGNIGRPEDILQVIEKGGDGVGLFRTEFLYMDRSSEPTEQEQYESYKFVLEKMDGKKVVIRTLDIGGDKTLPYMNLPREMNPFLGYRAIRVCLDQKALFKTQLKALLRASVHGNLSIMFPMISGLEEFLSAKEIVEECKKELDLCEIPYSNNIEIGIMIEVPSAAVCAEELAQYADFFSIGTNDLIQYTLAVDRMSERVSYLYNPMHPAVLKLIKMTIEGAHKHGKWVGMCGEMAGDESAILTLVEYGLDEFSMSASSILSVKKIIMGTI